MKLTFLGTNGWYDSSTGYTPSVLVETRNAYVVFDAGNGLVRLDAYIQTRKPIYVFLSHLHLDHVAGLHALAKFRFKQGLKLVLPKMFKAPLKTLLAQPFSVPVDKLPYAVTHLTLDEKLTLPFDLRWARLIHSSPCLGYRLTEGETSLVYATDTGICPNYRTLARQADLLITECAHRPGEVHPQWPHLNPEESAQVAKEEGVKQLVLMHFDASRYPTLADRRQAGVVAKTIFRKTRVAYDGMTLTLK